MGIMGKIKQVLVLEYEAAMDKDPETEGGKYRRDSPWLVESFKKKGVQSSILFITRKDTAEVLAKTYPDTAFLGRVNPMDYPDLSLDEYVNTLGELNKKGLLLGPVPEHMDRLGSKRILYELRDTSMGIEGVLLHNLEDMRKNEGEIDVILPKDGPPRVLKMIRGSTGFGVWKLESKGDNVLMTDAYTQKTDFVNREEVLVRFCELNQDAISMPFLPLITDGEFRFLMSKHTIVEIVHRRPVEENAFSINQVTGGIYSTPSLEEHNELVASVEDWTRMVKSKLKMDNVPYWWSVDCIEEEGLKPGQIPSSNAGKRLVLSEINCSCLGMAVNYSPEAKVKGMMFGDMIADICLSDLS